MPVGIKDMIAVSAHLKSSPGISEFFGFGVGRLHAEIAHALRALASDARQWCRDNDVSCLYFLGAAESVDNPGGFYFVDERVTLPWWDARPVEGTSPAVRPFPEPGDLAAA